jgi:hypothetical protein
MNESEEKELLEKIRKIHKEVDYKGHAFIIIALLILLVKSCGAH